MEVTTGQTSGAVVAGVIITFLTSFLKGLIPDTNTRARHLMFLVLSIIGAGISLGVDGQLNAESFTPTKFLVSLGIVISTANVLYNQLTSPSGVDNRIETSVEKSIM